MSRCDAASALKCTRHCNECMKTEDANENGYVAYPSNCIRKVMVTIDFHGRTWNLRTT